jgi:hypothetical protein
MPEIYNLKFSVNPHEEVDDDSPLKYCCLASVCCCRLGIVVVEAHAGARLPRPIVAPAADPSDRSWMTAAVSSHASPPTPAPESRARRGRPRGPHWVGPPKPLHDPDLHRHPPLPDQLLPAESPHPPLPQLGFTGGVAEQFWFGVEICV